jgi:hypothetical protein
MVARCGELLRALEGVRRTHFRHILTNDESWFCLEYQHGSQRSASRNEMSQRVEPAIGTAKFRLFAIWGVNGFHLLDLISSQCRSNPQYFLEHAMVPLVQTTFPQGRIWYPPRLTVHLDNCRVHFSKVTEQFFIENQLLHPPHSPYRDDLAPSDFWLSGSITTGLTGRGFTEPKELL